MASAFGHAESLMEDMGPLDLVVPEILTELKHLDLTGRIHFDESRVVGLGAYGDICKAWCAFSDCDQVRVAVKRLRFHLNEDIRTLFEKEIYVWQKLRHDDILPLLGFAFDSFTGYPLLISKWMANGTAWTFVSKHRDCDLMRLVTGIARGLAYLHNNGIIHSDIKSDNILVTENEDAVICDFGCSRVLLASRSLARPSTVLKGTARYLAYELIAPASSGHTLKTDVWAFGMTVFELLALQRPYENFSDGEVIAAIWRKELPVLPPTSTSTISLETRRILWDVCQQCWEPSPGDRADMALILKYLLTESVITESGQQSQDEDVFSSDSSPNIRPRTPSLLAGQPYRNANSIQRMSDTFNVSNELHDGSLEDRNTGHSYRPTSVENLAKAALVRFEQTGRSEDLDESIALHRVVLELQPTGHPDRPAALVNVASAVLIRFRQAGRSEDLDESISLHRAILELHPTGHPDRPAALGHLANTIFIRFQQAGQSEDLDELITLHREALCSHPAGHPDRPALLRRLEVAVHNRFLKTERLEDLDELTGLLHTELELHPTGQPDRPALLEKLGSIVLFHFQKTGQQDDLDEAIALHRAALELQPTDHSDRPVSLRNLANVLLTRFTENGQLEDLDESVALHQAGLNSTRQPDRFGSRGHLVNTINLSICSTEESRQEALIELITLHRAALELHPLGQNARPALLRNAASIIFTTFEKMGWSEDVNELIELYKAVLELHPTRFPVQPASLGNFADTLRIRFQQTGRLEDLDESISFQRAALELQPTMHPGRAAVLGNLANTIFIRFQQTEHSEDLDDLIAFQCMELELRPTDHPGRPVLVKNLADNVLVRFWRADGYEDLDESVSLQRVALELYPTNHPDRLALLAKLASTVLTRLGMTRQDKPIPPATLNVGSTVLGIFEDIELDGVVDELISLHHAILDLYPNGDPGRPSWLEKLSNSALTVFERAGLNWDADDFVAFHHAILEPYPTGHPGRPALLEKLGDNVLTRFKSMKWLNEFDLDNMDYLNDPDRLDELITTRRQSLDGYPADSPRLPGLLRDLADILLCRFIGKGRLEDLDESIALFRRISEDDFAVECWHECLESVLLFVQLVRERHQG